jgi:hypothetical protein
MNQRKKAQVLNQVVPDLCQILKDYAKGSPRSLTHKFLNELTPEVSAYCVTQGVLSSLVSAPEGRTFGSLLGSIRQELDLEFRMKELETNEVNKHFFTVPGEPSWSAARRLKSRTTGKSTEDLSKFAMVLLEVFLKRYHEDLIYLRLVWKGHRSFREVTLEPTLENYLLTNPEVLEQTTVLPEGSPCGPYLKAGKYGVKPVEPSSKISTEWNHYRISEDLQEDFALLASGMPSKLFHEVMPLSIGEDLPAALRGVLVRQERSRRITEVATRSAARILKDTKGVFRFPVIMDFRGRIYLSSPASPQSIKHLRPYLLSPEGRPFDYYDMKQSNVNLLSLLLSGRLYPGDYYEDLATEMRYAWSSLLDELVGECNRDLMKEWYGRVFFGQTWLSAYDTAIKNAVRHSPKFTNEVREEIKRVFIMGFDKAKNLSNPLVIDGQPHLITPDGWKVDLTYYRQTRKKIMSKFHGIRYTTHIHYDSDHVDVARINRAMTANIIHSLDAYILRQQLDALGPSVPIHDCIGIPQGVQGDILAEIARGCIEEFGVSLREQGFMTDNCKCLPFKFLELYEKEED